MCDLYGVSRHADILPTIGELMTALLTTLAINPHQPPAFEPQVLVHTVVGPVNPFLDLYLIDLTEVIDRLLVADDVLADRLAALLLDLEHPIIDADQLAATAQGARVSEAAGRCQSKQGDRSGQ